MTTCTAGVHRMFFLFLGPDVPHQCHSSAACHCLSRACDLLVSLVTTAALRRYVFACLLMSQITAPHHPGPGFHESAGPGPVGGRVWLALHGAFLFLSAGPEPWAPMLGPTSVFCRVSVPPLVGEVPFATRGMPSCAWLTWWFNAQSFHIARATIALLSHRCKNRVVDGL